MSNTISIPTKDISDFQGVYEEETNKVFLHVDCFYFSGPLDKEDINNIIESLKELQSKII